MLAVRCETAQTNNRHRSCTGSVQCTGRGRGPVRGERPQQRDGWMRVLAWVGQAAALTFSGPALQVWAKRGAVSEPALGWQRGPDQDCTAGKAWWAAGGACE